MEKRELNNSFTRILTQLRIAEEELNRPLEDVVSMSVCLGARRSIFEMMSLYLQSKGRQNTEIQSLDQLLEGCKSLDPAFEEISLSGIACKHMDNKTCDGVYCLEHENIDHCIKIANELKDIFLNKFGITENEIS